MRYSLFSVLGQALRGQRDWKPQWRDAAPKADEGDAAADAGAAGAAGWAGPGRRTTVRSRSSSSKGEPLATRR